jgi:hypothetical protein
MSLRSLRGRRAGSALGVDAMLRETGVLERIEREVAGLG